MHIFFAGGKKKNYTKGKHWGERNLKHYSCVCVTFSTSFHYTKHLVYKQKVLFHLGQKPFFPNTIGKRQGCIYSRYTVVHTWQKAAKIKKRI